MGMRQALKFEKETPKHLNLISGPNLFSFRVLQFEAALSNFI